MAIPKHKKQISIVIDKPVYDKLALLSKKLHRPVSKLAKNFLYAGLEDAELFNKIGLVSTIGFFRGMSENVNDKGYWSRETGVDFEEEILNEQEEENKVVKK